jgi:hypothetical protein
MGPGKIFDPIRTGNKKPQMYSQEMPGTAMLATGSSGCTGSRLCRATALGGLEVIPSNRANHGLKQNYDDSFKQLNLF